MANRNAITGLTLLALAGAANAQNPKVSVEMAHPTLIPGQSSSYTIKVDATGFPEEVWGIWYNKNPLPTAIQQPLNGHDIYEQDGVFVKGFLQGKNVNWYATQFPNDLQGAVQMDPSSFPGVFEPNEKAVTYNFSVRSDATPGVCTVSLNGAGLTCRQGMNFFEYMIEPGDLTPGTFQIVLPLRGDLNCDEKVNFDDINPFVAALAGGRAVYEAQYPNCSWFNADIDGSGSVNFDDINPFVACIVSGGCP